MQAMIGFTKALMSMPMPWQLWIGLLVAVNVAGPIYFFEALEAKVVLAAFLASAASMMAIFAAKGFVRLLGIGHIFWIPMVPWLWTRLDQVEPGDLIGYWMIAVVAVNGISLIIDTIDVGRYVTGDRKPYVTVAD
jgi:roadblock/LC7 domain-containing protein